MNILYIFVDESGDLKFTPKSSNNFYMGGLVCRGSIDGTIYSSLYDIKHECLALDDCRKFEYFHAAENLQSVRDKVFEVISSIDNKDVGFYSVYSEKCKANPYFHSNTDKYYYKHCVWLLHSILYGETIESYDKILIFFDGMPVAKNKKAMFKGLKEELSHFFKDKNIKIPYYIYSHQSKSHLFLQIVDYINWSINVKFERSELRPYDSVKHLVANVFSVFDKSENKYY